MGGWGRARRHAVERAPPCRTPLLRLNVPTLLLLLCGTADASAVTAASASALGSAAQQRYSALLHAATRRRRAAWERRGFRWERAEWRGATAPVLNLPRPRRLRRADAVKSGLCARAPASDGWAPPLDHTTLERHKGGWGQPDCTYFDTPRSWWDQLKARGVNWGTKELLMKQANALMELYGEKRRRDSVAASVCSCTIWGLRGEWHGVACGCPA
eukprot:gene29168-11844_t